jgi:hypothetical protein
MKIILWIKESAVNLLYYYPNSRPLVKLKSYNFKPMKYEIRKSSPFRSLDRTCNMFKEAINVGF